MPPDAWRTRFDELRRELASNGPLARELRQVREIAEREGDLAGQAAAAELAARHPDLLPGEAGEEVAWSIVCGQPFTPLRPAAGHGERDLFAEPVDDYTAPPRAGAKNRFRARRLRQPALIEELLGLLAGSLERPPATHRQVSGQLRRSATQLHQLLEVLRKSHGLRLRSAAEQKQVHGIVSPHDRRRLTSKEEFLLLSPEEAESRTGLPHDVLKARGCQVVRVGKIGDPELVEKLQVPRGLIIFDEPHRVRPPEERPDAGRERSN